MPARDHQGRVAFSMIFAVALVAGGSRAVVIADDLGKLSCLAEIGLKSTSMPRS
jgi:hypothetical protein